MSKRVPVHAPVDAPDQPAIWRSLTDKNHPERREIAAGSEVEVQLGDLIPMKAKVGRRSFMAVSGASAAAVGLSGCLRRPVDHILPHSRGPEYALPGMPLHYATSVSHGGEGFGLLVESHEGRPTKIEGNPDHPASQGATDARLQGMILDLYDPDRARTPSRGAADGAERPTATWAQFDTFWREKSASLEASGGRGLRILLEPLDSPSMLRAREQLRVRFPQATVHTWTPISYASIREGARLAFGAPAAVQYDFARARVVLSLDADFLGSEPGFVRNARGFAEQRGIERPAAEMSRLYVVEGTFSLTGMNADHRLRVAPSRIDGYLRALTAKLGTLPGIALPPAVAAGVRGASAEGIPAQWVDAVAADLASARGRSIVTVGWRQPAHVHALALAINAALQNIGSTVAVFPALDAEEPDHVSSLRELTEAMGRGEVDTLVVLGGNPAYDAPSDIDFGAALARVENSVHLSDRVDETSAGCGWHLPRAHELESWGDHKSVDGTVSIQQPLIAPLHQARSEAEVLGMLAGIRGWRGSHLVRRTTSLLLGGGTDTAFDRAWRASLHQGVVIGAPRARPIQPGLQEAAIAGALSEHPARAAGGVEVVFAPSYQTWDGRQANNAWLLELPDPVTKVVWDNVAYLSPATAQALGIEPPDPPPSILPPDMEALRHGALIELSREGAGSITIPAYVLPGHADDVVTLPLGFGRTKAGRYGDGVGVDTYAFRTSDALGFAGGVRMSLAGGRHEVVVTQAHHSMVGRPIAIDATLEQYRATPDFPQWRDGDRVGNPTPRISPLWTQVDYSAPQEPAQGGLTYGIYPEPRTAREGAPPRYKWGFVVDLSRCTGCSACIVACQAENNIAIVGKQQVALGREMHWMRLDRYFVGSDANEPSVSLQPVGCQHCEEAPCENVCPVAATAHSPEGLNDMAYNRCIGTRYCMNNCPYKVRRFNYLDFHGHIPELRTMQFNPNVTVRMRGVMEKCSYCVQRIQYARIQARRDTTVDAAGAITERRIGPEDLQSACAQACPSQAITFGDLNDTRSPTHRRAHLDRQYKLLAFVGTQPRTTYLGKLRNPNTEMA